MIFDSHAHYDDEQFDCDREELLDSMQEHGIGGIINVGASMEGVFASQELAKKYPFIYAGVGIHPDYVGSLNEEKLRMLAELCKKPKTVVVGEIGLDYYWDKEAHDIQKRWFIEQLKMAQEAELPVNTTQQGCGEGYIGYYATGACGYDRRDHSLLFLLSRDGDGVCTAGVLYRYRRCSHLQKCKSDEGGSGSCSAEPYRGRDRLSISGADTISGKTKCILVSSTCDRGNRTDQRGVPGRS